MTFSLAPNLLEYFVDRDKIVMDVCKSRYYEKNCKSVFFTGKVTFLFESFCFQHSLSFCRIDLVTCTTLVWIFFLGQWNCFLMSRYSVIRKKTGQNHREGSIFFYKISPSASYVLTKWSFILQKKCQETIWAVINCSLRFLKLHRTKKEGPNISFLKKLWFQLHHR